MTRYTQKLQEPSGRLASTSSFLREKSLLGEFRDHRRSLQSFGLHAMLCRFRPALLSRDTPPDWRLRTPITTRPPKVEGSSIDASNEMSTPAPKTARMRCLRHGRSPCVGAH